MRPVIGVTPLWDDKLESLWMLPGYFDGLAEAGATPLMLPLTDDPGEIAQLTDLCDGILVAGGHDVGPSLYGEEPGPRTVELCPARDRMERLLIPAALDRGKPLLGICRGIQVMNAVLGGTLWQDLPTERPGTVEHHGKPPYDQVVHTVAVEPGSPLAEAVWPGGDSLERVTADATAGAFDTKGHPYHPEPYTMGVNSYHHQGIRDLAPSLAAMATAPDGLVEAVWMPEADFVWGVQWHPEFAHAADANQRRILAAFARAAVRSRV